MRAEQHVTGHLPPWRLAHSSRVPAGAGQRVAPQRPPAGARGLSTGPQPSSVPPGVRILSNKQLGRRSTGPTCSCVSAASGSSAGPPAPSASFSFSVRLVRLGRLASTRGTRDRQQLDRSSRCSGKAGHEGGWGAVSGGPADRLAGVWHAHAALSAALSTAWRRGQAGSTGPHEEGVRNLQQPAPARQSHLQVSACRQPVQCQLIIKHRAVEHQRVQLRQLPATAGSSPQRWGWQAARRARAGRWVAKLSSCIVHAAAVRQRAAASWRRVQRQAP